MNKDMILKLLQSQNDDDILIATLMIAKLADPRGFFKENGRILEGVTDRPSLEIYGKRYQIRCGCSGGESFYVKVTNELYILRNSTLHISECYSNYSKDIKVIEP